jgi:concanavalin A-like lectin/glucanase superfamily protein
MSPPILTTGVGKFPIVGGGGGGLGLQTNCIAFYEMENTSWLDSTSNSYTMTASGSPTSISGLVGNCGHFVSSSSQYLKRTYNTDFAVSAVDWSVTFWFKAASFIDSAILSRDDTGFGNHVYMVYTGFGGSGQNLFFNVYTNGGTNNNTLQATSFGNLSTGTWYFGAFTYTNSTNTGRLSINAGTQDSIVTINNPINNATFDPMIGATVPSSPAQFWNGDIDQVGFWKGRVLSTSDITALYNGGSGLTWAGMA